MNNHTRLSTYLHPRRAAVVVASVLASVIFVASAPHRVRTIDLSNFQILGITLGDSSIEDIKRKIGPASEMPAKDPENSVMCYVSPGNHPTTLEFENWTEPIEFRLFQTSEQRATQCTVSRKVSKSLSTGSGLRLGMDRRRVVQILGRPYRIKGTHFVYESTYTRSLKPEEQKRATKVTPLPKTMEVYERIDLQFDGSSVIRIDAVRSEAW